MIANTESVCLINVADFLKKYPRFRKFLNGEGQLLFTAIMQPTIFVEASILAKYKYPALLVVAEPCQAILQQNQSLQADGFTKQFIGSVVCALMEANGFRKTGKKKSVPHSLFTIGELYEIEV